MNGMNGQQKDSFTSSLVINNLLKTSTLIDYNKIDQNILRTSVKVYLRFSWVQVILRWCLGREVSWTQGRFRAARRHSGRDARVPHHMCV